MAQEPTTQPQPAPAATPKDAAADVMAVRKAAGSIAEVFDNPNAQPQRVRIG